MQLYDCRDLVLGLDGSADEFEISQLMVGKIIGPDEQRYRTIRFTMETLKSLPLRFPLDIRSRGSGETLIRFKALKLEIHASRCTMDVSGEERIASDRSCLFIDDLGD